jgi:DNA-binding transcriptional ArsR family regulator
VPFCWGRGAAPQLPRYRKSLCERLTVRASWLILSYMVNFQERLDRTFMALTDPTRRAILARLEREDGASISELAKPFPIRLPAVMKHLEVLASAGLVTRSKAGRTVTVRLRAQPMREAVAWLQRYERFWSSRLDRLTSYAESKEADARRKGR